MSIAERNAAASSSRVGMGVVGSESGSPPGKDNDRNGSIRTRSVSRRREGLGRGRSMKSLGKDRDQGIAELERAKSPISDAGTSASVIAGRKVRTVPPSARFDPPTPEPDDERDNILTAMSSQNGTMTTNSTQPQAQPQAQAQRKRPRPKIRYSTSSESDGDSDDSDEEPPWWTFTQRGMMKMRARSLGVGRTKSPVEEAGSDVTTGHGLGHGHGQGTGNGDDTGVGTGGDVELLTATAESGLDTRDKEKVTRRKIPGSRKSSREKNASRDGSTPSSSIKGQNRSGSPSRMPFLHSGFPHTALRFPAHFRSSPKGTPVPLSLDTSRGRMQRSNSAPGSPNVESTSPALPTIATLVSAAAEADPDHPVEVLSEADDHPEPRDHESEHSQLDADHSGPVLPRTRQRPKRQATAPAFSFLKRLSDTGENLTDSEAAMFTSPRVRAKAKLSPTEMIQALDRAEISESPLSQTPDGSATPTRPKAWRRQTHRLRINLPPPITQHFANGWPHAGSWQDALYGHYDEYPASSRRYPTGTPGSRTTPGIGVVQSGRSSHEHFPSATANRVVNGNGNATGTSLPTSRPASVLDVARPPFTPRASHDGSPASSPPPAEVERPKRTRTKRRRYRQALVPPTPQGLGFSPTDRDEVPQPAAWKEGRVGEHGFDWGTGRAGLIEEGDELSRAETRGTMPMTMNEKGGSGRGRRRWWPFGPRDTSKRRMIDEDWRKRWRRILFLDARVTIWIRLVNLAVAVTLLGLALTIRFELIRLHLPGMMGSSTTLVIAYSSLTVFHVLTAIYREYFGKPIGLWGLRSKMLWVCLDLCFVALWSSAVSLATNDYIATPLECTTASPWWRSGLSTDYAELLDDLQLLSSAGNSTAIQSSAIDRVTPASLIGQTLGIILPAEIVESSLTREACRRQSVTIALSMLALLLYGGNMVLSLFRIFETVRRTANVDRAVMV